MLFVLSLPVSASLVLALDFAFTNKSLQKRLNKISVIFSKKYHSGKRETTIVIFSK